MAYVLDSLPDKRIWGRVGEKGEDILYDNGRVGIAVSSNELLNSDPNTNLFVKDNMRIGGSLIVDNIQTNAVYNKDTSSILVNTGDTSGDTSGGGSTQWIPTSNNTAIYSLRNVGIGLNGPQYPLDVSGIIRSEKIITDSIDLSYGSVFPTLSGDISFAFDNRIWFGDTLSLDNSGIELTKNVVFHDTSLTFRDEQGNTTTIDKSFFDNNEFSHWKRDGGEAITTTKYVGIGVSDVSDVNETVKIDGGLNISGDFVFNGTRINPDQSFGGAKEIGKLNDVLNLGISKNDVLLGNNSGQLETRQLKTDVIVEGNDNLFYTDSRVDSYIQSDIPVSKLANTFIDKDNESALSNKKALVWRDDKSYTQKWIPDTIVNAIELKGTKHTGTVSITTDNVQESNDKLYLNKNNLNKFNIDDLNDVALLDLNSRKSGYLFFNDTKKEFGLVEGDPDSGSDSSAININGSEGFKFILGINDLIDVSENTKNPTKDSLLTYDGDADKWVASTPRDLNIDKLNVDDLTINNTFNIETGPDSWNTVVIENSNIFKTHEWVVNEKRYTSIENEPLVRRVSNIRYSKFDSDNFGVFRMFDVSASSGRAQGYFTLNYWIHNTELNTKNSPGTDLSDSRYLAEGRVSVYFDTSAEGDSNGSFFINGYGEMYENTFDSSLSFADRFATLGIRHENANELNKFSLLVSEYQKQDNYFLNFDAELYVLQGEEPIFYTPNNAEYSDIDSPADTGDFESAIQTALNGETEFENKRIDQILPTLLDSQNVGRRYVQYVPENLNDTLEFSYKNTPITTVATWEYDPSYVQFTLNEPEFTITNTSVSPAIDGMHMTYSTSPPLTTFDTDVSINHTLDVVNDISAGETVYAKDINITDAIYLNNDKTWRVRTKNDDLVFEHYDGSSFIEKQRFKSGS